MELIKRGEQAGFIRFDEERKFITYTAAGKRQRYTDPEEQVRAEIYLQLIFDYGYEAKRVEIERVVPRRTPSDLADIVIFNDDRRKEPWIVVECKRQEISDAEFVQAIEQGFGNANSLSAPYLIVTSGLKTQYYDVKNFPSLEREANQIADIPPFGESAPAKYKFAKGGVFDIARVPEQYLTRIFKQAHDALWAGGKRNPAEAFDELDKIIFCKLWDERMPRKEGEPYDFQVFSNEPPEKLLNRLKAIYNKGREKDKDKEVFKDEIRLSAREIERIVGYLAPINLSDTDLDSKGRAFETFMGSFFRGEFGQYFTPRTIVQFIVDALPIKNESLVLDPACGSGGFLLHALDKVRKQADKMASDGYFAKGSRQHFDHWHDFAEHNLYGIEISDSIARTAKMNMIIHDDGHTNVVAHDGLEKTDVIRSGTRNEGFKENRFDFIITNPPFGSSVKASEHRYMEDYKLGLSAPDWIEAKLNGYGAQRLRNRQSSEVLFIEKCHLFLKTNGSLAMVVPDGILTNSSLQYVRDWIEEHFRILAVVSLPQTAFTATGAGVKSSVVFLQKHAEATTAAIRAQKDTARGRLFAQPKFGAAILELEAQKAKAIKDGDAIIREMQEDLVLRLETFKDEGIPLPESERKRLRKETEAHISVYKKTDAYREWLRETTDEHNERIDNLKEALQDAAQEAVAEELEDYPIFMAIAEHIGFDATGRQTGRNELDDIAGEILRFIEAVGQRQDAFFV